jgi:hypothetical protein
MYLSGPIIGLTRHYEMTGDKQSLEMLDKLVRFVIQPKYWQTPGEPEVFQGARHAHYRGHIHGHLTPCCGQSSITPW